MNTPNIQDIEGKTVWLGSTPYLATAVGVKTVTLSKDYDPTQDSLYPFLSALEFTMLERTDRRIYRLRNCTGTVRCEAENGSESPAKHLVEIAYADVEISQQ